jgi:hypothetical protein
MPRPPKLHTYRVVSRATVALVEAPSPLAAAVFVGERLFGRFGSMAAIDEEDGRPWRGAAVWRRWMPEFGEEPSTVQLDQLRDELPFCRFTTGSPALAAA